uniref:Uncharacterized protein n=1 Tax=Rhizophora mucronata TaxID=61149 RepID=A0A2P2LR53_RHIMU
MTIMKLTVMHENLLQDYNVLKTIKDAEPMVLFLLKMQHFVPCNRQSPCKARRDSKT